MRRALVTGVGAITSFGSQVETAWSRLSASGRHNLTGISPLPSHHPLQKVLPYAGWISDTALPAVEGPTLPLGPPRASLFALLASQAALKDALHQESLFDNLPNDEYKLMFPSIWKSDRIGVVTGTGLADMESWNDAFTMLTQEEESNQTKSSENTKRSRIGPWTMTRLLPNTPSSLISLQHGITGASHTVAGACAAGSQAIMIGAQMIAEGRLDVAIVGGCEAPLTPLIGLAFKRARALSQYPDPAESSRPFDSKRCGFVMSEGAAYIVLEAEDIVRARGGLPSIYAILEGSGASSDAHHMVAPHPEGEGQLRAMRQALIQARRSPLEVAWLSAHATGTKLGDLAEAKAIKGLNSGREMMVSSIKGAFGHHLGGAGALQAVMGVLGVRDKIVPPNVTLEALDEELTQLDLSIVSPTSTKHRFSEPGVRNLVLTSSSGFGGTNCSLLFGPPPPYLESLTRTPRN